MTLYDPLSSGENSPTSRISKIGALKAKITQNFLEKNQQARKKWAKNAPFASVFQKFSRGTPAPDPNLQEDKKTLPSLALYDPLQLR